MTSWLRVPAVVMTVPAVVAVTADVAHAQIEHELELGGGFHVALPFHDVVALHPQAECPCAGGAVVEPALGHRWALHGCPRFAARMSADGESNEIV